MANYNGLTRNTWPGTWSPTGNHPIVLDTEVRGTLRFVSGEVGDRLTDITGQRLQEGMLAYLKTGYGVFSSDTYYIYRLLDGQSRNESTGEMPNSDANWSRVPLSSITAADINISPSGSVEASTLDGALVELANQHFFQAEAPGANATTEGAFWYETDTENLYVCREISTGVYNWVPLLMSTDDSDTLDGGSY